MTRVFLLFLASVTVLLGADTKAGDLAAAKKQPPKVLEPFVVREDSTLSFGVALKMLRFTLTKKVAAIYVDEVEEGSDAASQEVRAGMQILSLDGKPVGDFDATFQEGSALRKLLIGRKPNDTLVIEVDPMDGTKPRKITLHNHRRFHVEMKQTNPLTQRSKDDAVFDQPVFQK